jgi:putative aldouronate transport system substrate-binding protein
VEVEKILGVKFEDKYQGNGAAKEFEFWKDRLNEVDMISGTAATLSEYGEAGSLVNLAEYLDKMPSFKAYLEANPIVRLSITGNTSTGAIYFSPYFDGVNDIERMPLMRVDWVQKLLDGEGEFTADACNKLAPVVYEPYMPTSGTVEIETVKLDGSGTETVTKNYDAFGNVVAIMNDAGELTGVDAVNLLRKYIDAAYGGYYGTERSNLFVGQNAAWDADEMVALLRCVVANPQTLNGTDSVQGLFTREEANNQRRVDMIRLAGHLFGVRGMESRQDYLYVGADGELHDARQETAAYEAMGRMNAMAQEGLISKAFLDSSEENSGTYLENDLGFMSYDYNQTQTIMNATKLQEGEKYMAVMVPVARWYDGTNDDGVYMRFTESWRSVKTDGWAISKAGVEGNEAKLNAALALIDYAFSDKGQILMSYGPDAFIKTKEDGSYETFVFNGKEMPVIADATYAELWEKASGNYTNYARMYLGSTLSFAKSQAFEYQCTSAVGKEGAGHISTAIGLGTIKHPELAIAENPWYTSVPTVLPNTKVENDELNTYTELTANGKFNLARDGENVFVDIIVKGFTLDGMTSPEEAAETVDTAWFGFDYLLLKGDAWARLLDYYSGL